MLSAALLSAAPPLTCSLPLTLLLPLGSSARPLSHCRPRRLLPVSQQAVGTPNAGREMLHHLVAPPPHGDLTSLALARLLWTLLEPGGAFHAFLGS